MIPVFFDPAILPSLSILAGTALDDFGFRWTRQNGSPNWLFIFVGSGVGACKLDGVETKFEKGQLAIWKPGTYQEYFVPSGSTHMEQLWVHAVLSPPFTNIASLLTRGKNFHVLTPDPSFEARFRRLATHPRTLQGDLRCMNELEAILLDLIPDETELRKRGPIEKSIEHLRANISESIGVEDLAKAAELSPSRLTTLFRAKLGVSPRTFIERERINYSKHLLRMTSRSIKAISKDVGYESPFYFSLRFKKIVGQSPSHFRHVSEEVEES